MLSGLENPFHLLILLTVVLLLFGAKRLPDMGRSLGRGMREFKEAITGNGPPEPAMAAERAEEALPAGRAVDA